MPHIQIWNHPRGFDKTDAGMKLYRELHVVVAGVKELGLGPEHVTVNYVCPAFAQDSCVIVYINALLQKEGRNGAVIKGLANAVCDCVVRWLDVDERYDCKVEVIVSSLLSPLTSVCCESQTRARSVVAA